MSSASVHHIEFSESIEETKDECKFSLVCVAKNSPEGYILTDLVSFRTVGISGAGAGGGIAGNSLSINDK